MSYKIVFQGGGAKLFPLIAAVEALQEQVKSDNNFTLDTVAGASAGSIAAMLLAADIDCTKLKDHFKTEKGKASVFSAFPAPTHFKLLKCLFFGSTIFDRKQLESLLYQMLEIGGYKNKKDIVNLSSILKVAITDLKKSQIEFVELSACSVEEIVRNVADSCSIPFFFKNHKSSTNWEFVDGGLFENFPVSSIINNVEESRKVLGFSFEEENKKENETNPKLLNYVKILMSTAIDANIGASLRLIGSENTFPIKTDISTLDFVVGLKQFVEVDNRLENLKKNVKSWIDDIVRRERQIDAAISAGARSLVPTDFQKFKETISYLYEKRKTINLVASYHISYMQINSVFPDFSPNKSHFEYLYRKTIYLVPEEGIECIAFGTSYSSTIDVEKFTDFSVVDDKGKEINFVVMPMILPRISNDFICLGIFLDQRQYPDITANITIVQKQFLPNSLSKLTDSGVCHLGLVGTTETVPKKSRLFIGLPQENINSYKLTVLSKYHEEIEDEPIMVGGLDIEDVSEISDVKAAGSLVLGFEAKESLIEGKAFILEVKDINFENKNT